MTFMEGKNALEFMQRNMHGVGKSVEVDALKESHRVANILDEKPASEDGNQKVSHRIHKILTGDPEPEFGTWVGEHLKDPGVQMHGKYWHFLSKHPRLPHPLIQGRWKTSRDVFVDVGEDGHVEWEPGAQIL